MKDLKYHHCRQRLQNAQARESVGLFDLAWQDLDLVIKDCRAIRQRIRAKQRRAKTAP